MAELMSVPKLQPWVEKYRPRSVDEVAHQDEVVQTLKKAIATNSMPHLLFYGPPGTGKTSTILALARAMFGNDIYRQRILELNASDERGIKMVREKIKQFAQAAVGKGSSMQDQCGPSFKLIILDEADTMTSDAQTALRRVMEVYTKVTRFCLICNYVTRIISPLASRCAKFRFRPLSEETMLQRLQYIANAEAVSIDKSGIKAVIDYSAGDMRKAVTMLQSLNQLYRGTNITRGALAEISGKVTPQVVDELWKVIRSRDTDQLVQGVTTFISEGSPLSSLLCTFQEDVVNDDTISDIKKAAICEKLAEVNNSLLIGGSEELQLFDLCSHMMRTLTS